MRGPGRGGGGEDRWKEEPERQKERGHRPDGPIEWGKVGAFRVSGRQVEVTERNREEERLERLQGRGQRWEMVRDSGR